MKPTDKERKSWLRKNGQHETVYRWDWFSMETRAKVRKRVDAVMADEKKGEKK